MGVDFRYRRLGYLALNVSDIEKSAAFATNVFGMDAAGEGADGARFFRIGPQHHDVMLIPAEKPGFVRSSWELETEEDLDRALAHYQRIGLAPQLIPQEEAAMLGLERAFRIVEPKLNTVWEYYARMSYTVAPRQNRLTNFQGGKHYGLVIPDCKAVTDYMVENMGFLVSDYLEGWRASLLRAFPNPNHHSFAPLQFPAPRPTFHHLAFMVDEIDDIGKLFNRIKRYDVQIQFGIGRHPTSGSIHLYIYDPDYFVWEYTLGMEQFPETGAREPRRMSADPANFDLWDAVPDTQHAAKFPGLVTG
ncbi:VOC family protein [Flavisphingomonas formosensis]|uniref:VOC family protein n=1 Tax=Flavisphingomonas formosensis TaxID=861534 RepID=UPI0012F7DD13|nr:VOC family protein [Sphingomonas formosensis]